MTATSVPTVSVHDCDNHWDEGKITTEPTCTEKGKRTFTCNICQNTKTEEVAPTGHKYAEDWTIDIAPTCETTGTKSHHCKACDDKADIESIPALGHSWKDNGDGTAICSREGCGKVHTHQWGNSRVEKDATCVEAGTRIFSCAYDENCKAVKTEKIDPLGHDYKVSKIEPATCEKSGEIYSVCNRCEAKKVEKNTSAPALGHIWEDKNDGTAICTREGCTKTHIHVWDEGTLEIAPTCIEKGKRVLHCTYDENCQATTEKEEKELGHDYQLSITEAPTCESAGKLHYKCSRCEATKVEEDKSNPALSHKNTEVRNNVEATCCTEGYTGDVYCKDCKIKLSSGTVIPLIAHEWNKGKITKKATYTSKGEIVYTCKLCEDKKKVSIPKLAYPKTGTVYTISGNQYKVTKVGTEVSLIHTKKNAKSISIPATITAQGITYKVVTVASKAFNNNTKLSKVTIGKNIVKINNKAFFKCKNLKTVNIQTVLLTKKTASKKAFVGVNKKLVVKVPKKVKKAYMVVLKGIKVK